MSNVIEFKLGIPTDLMTFEEIEKKYRLKYHTLYKYACKENKIPYYRIGGLRVSEKDVIRWIEQSRVPARGLKWV